MTGRHLSEFFHIHLCKDQEYAQIAEGLCSDKDPGHGRTERFVRLERGNIIINYTEDRVENAGRKSGHTCYDRTVNGHGKSVRADSVDRLLMVEDVRQKRQ